MAKKKGKPVSDTKAPVRKGEVVNVWINPRLAAALERYIGESRPRPTKTSAIEAGLEMLLEDKGYWPPPTEEPQSS